MKRSILVIMIFICAFLSFGCSAVIENAQNDLKEETLSHEFAKPMVKELGENLSIAVDPKIESAYLVFEMISLDTGFSQYEGSTYMDDQVKHFEEFRDHEVFNIARRMAMDGFKYDAIASSLHLFKDDITLKEGIVPDENVLARAGGIENIEEFLVALYDFRKESDYDAYFELNDTFYQEYMDRAENYLSSSSFYDVFSNYYGNLSGDIRITITPECGHGYGCSNKYENRIDLMPTIPVSNYDKDFIGVLIHELSHPFVNHETARRADIVENTEELYAPISGPMSSKLYSNWEISLNEHIVRANTIYMMGQIFGDKSTKSYLKRDENDGFIYIEPIYESIKYYETNRETYKTFSEYYDVLMSDIEKIEK